MDMEGHQRGDWSKSLVVQRRLRTRETKELTKCHTTGPSRAGQGTSRGWKRSYAVLEGSDRPSGGWLPKLPTPPPTFRCLEDP